MELGSELHQYTLNRMVPIFGTWEHICLKVEFWEWQKERIPFSNHGYTWQLAAISVVLDSMSELRKPLVNYKIYPKAEQCSLRYPESLPSTLWLIMDSWNTQEGQHVKSKSVTCHMSISVTDNFVDFLI